MKKVYILLIIFVILVCICGCSGKERVVLTRDNFANYFYYSCEYRGNNNKDVAQTFTYIFKKTDPQSTYILADSEAKIEIDYNLYFMVYDSISKENIMWTVPRKFTIGNEELEKGTTISNSSARLSYYENVTFLYEEIIPYGVILIEK